MKSIKSKMIKRDVAVYDPKTGKFRPDIQIIDQNDLQQETQDSKMDYFLNSFYLEKSQERNTKVMKAEFKF